MAFGKHPAEELYDKEKDPGQINNFVNDPNYSVIKEELSEKLKQYLRQTNDPRLFGDDTFDTYIYDTENWVESTFGISEFPH